MNCWVESVYATNLHTFSFQSTVPDWLLLVAKGQLGDEITQVHIAILVGVVAKEGERDWPINLSMNSKHITKNDLRVSLIFSEGYTVKG